MTRAERTNATAKAKEKDLEEKLDNAKNTIKDLDSKFKDESEKLIIMTKDRDVEKNKREDRDGRLKTVSGENEKNLSELKYTQHQLRNMEQKMEEQETQISLHIQQERKLNKDIKTKKRENDNLQHENEKLSLQKTNAVEEKQLAQSALTNLTREIEYLDKQTRSAD